MPKKKQKTWLKLRHKIITKVAGFFIYPFLCLAYNVKIKKIAKDQDRQYLILFNHQTLHDQFIIGFSFRRPIYYLASEDLFSNGFISTLLKWAVAPIPIKKQATDVRAVMNCIKVAKEGGSIALSPEGNRTYSGKTEYINPAVCGLIKALKLPVAFVRIEGGYGIHPRWSDKIRRGKMQSHVSKILEYEEYSALSDEQILQIVKNELYVDEGKVSGEYHHKKSAEYLERALYVCPTCGFSAFESKGDKVCCKQCGLTAKYTKTKQFEAVKGNLPFEFMTQWYDYQANFMNNTDLSAYFETPLYTEKASLFKVVIYKSKKKVASDITLKLYGNRIEISGGANMVLDFDKLRAVAVLGRNKLNLYLEDELLQIKADKRFNALKYVHTYYRYNSMKEGEENGKLLFLGL